MQLAALQFGAIGTHQLTTELGHSMRSISRARRRGVLLDVAPGVVRLASHPETFLMRCAAVQLHTRGIGFLSGWSAARLIGLRKMPRDPIHYTVPPSHRRTPPAWVELHVTSWYDPIDDRSAGPHDLTIASPMRMLWGLAAAFNQHRFERAAEDAWHLKLITPSAAADYLERHRCRGKDGVRRIESWLERATSQSAPSQSELERDLLDALARAGLPTPRRQHPLTLASGGVIHLDIAWPAALLAVEPGPDGGTAATLALVVTRRGTGPARSWAGTWSASTRPWWTTSTAPLDKSHVSTTASAPPEKLRIRVARRLDSATFRVRELFGTAAGW